jgi:hypothetical protein
MYYFQDLGCRKRGEKEILDVKKGGNTSTAAIILDVEKSNKKEILDVQKEKKVHPNSKIYQQKSILRYY